jgi:membrane-bound lytic murein transglycosylase D
MEMGKIKFNRIRKYSVLAFLAMGSCSVLQKPEAISTENNNNIVAVDTTEVLEDTLSADMSELGGVFYKDNSIPDSIWELDEDLLLKNMDNDDYISSVDSTWMDQLYKAGVFDSKSGNSVAHKTNVLHVDDSIIKKRLLELNRTTPLDLDYNPYVKRYINTYLYKRSSQMERMMGLAEYYYPMFEEILDKYDIPLELKHLAIVESALNPRAKSRVGASGLWQFMYATGKQYGLHVSSYVDERYDPFLETEAAAKYMRNLYKMFGDWNLVLAAYNSGPGNVKKAIRRSGGHRNFWYIRPYLPRETRGYVPAFIAVNYAMHYAEEHNLKAISPKISYYQTDTVMVKSKISFKQISDQLDISCTELEFLNPSYKHKIIPYLPKKGYKLVLPISNIDDFVSREDSIYAYANKLNEKNKAKMPKYYEANDMIRYRVRSGDVLGSIADRYGVRVSEIKRWNRLKNNNIRVGQRLTIYPRKFNTYASSSKKKSSKSKKSAAPVKQVDIKGGYELYTVKSGDSLWLIAKKYPGISAKNIQSWNGIGNSTSLRPGMKLKIATKG